EVSRQVTLEARENGITQLFVSDPLLFSEKLLEGRVNQFKEAHKNKASLVFLDRGIPEVLAYLDRGNTPYPNHFTKACEDNQYDRVFIFPPWEEIYTSDNERYEDYQEALKIYPFLKAAYDRFGYESIILPKDTIENRISFVLENI
ncbi:ATP-binding protein, partial [Flavobacteriaceae bacterium]|nr:ATP-binding protein [Flavobacteriaceae bacterium]